MPFVAQCPFCAVKVRLSGSAEGASVNCPRCRNYFTAADAQGVFAPSRAATTTAPAADAAQVPIAVAANTATAADAACGGSAELRLLTVPPPPSPAVVPSLYVWEVAGLMAASAALISASISSLMSWTIPLAVVGLLAALLALVGRGLQDRPSTWGAGGAVAGAACSLAVLLCVWLSPQVFGPEWFRGPANGPDRQQAYFVPAEGVRVAKLEPLGADDWVDTKKGAWRQGDVQVRVVSAAVESVRSPSKGGNQSRTNLAVRLKVRNVGVSKPFDFAGWGQAASLALRDRRGRNYQARGTAPSAAKVAAPPTSLAPGRFAEEVLLFEPPAADVEELFLELPPTPVGAARSLRFKVAMPELARK